MKIWRFPLGISLTVFNGIGIIGFGAYDLIIVYKRPFGIELINYKSSNI